jgi:hypothetical protein
MAPGMKVLDRRYISVDLAVAKQYLHGAQIAGFL